MSFFGKEVVGLSEHFQYPALPYPEWLRPSRSVPQVSADFVRPSAPGHEATSSTAIRFEHITSATSSVSSASGEIADEIEAPSVTEASVTIASEQRVPELETMEAPLEHQDDLKMYEDEDLQEQEEESEYKKYPRPAPRGRRVHHSEQLEKESRPSQSQVIQALSTLKAKDLQWLDNLLSHQVQQVSYLDFSRIWERLNGKNSIVKVGSGGSHRKLYDLTKKYAGETFAHNKNQIYYKGFLPYLVGAFSKIGINQETLKAYLSTQKS